MWGWVSREAIRIAHEAGFTAGLNDPFAGGFVVERHGNPRRNVHAIQLELDRRCYLDPALDRPGPGFDAAAFPVAYNDVDLCLRLGARGLKTVWTPYAVLRHKETATRERDYASARWVQYQRESAAFRERWGRVIAPTTSGRLWVRFIILSFSISMHWFAVLADRDCT